MENYSLENLISTLFALGFEQVDSTLITLMIGKIFTEQIKTKEFKYEDNEFTIQFQKFVVFDGLIYKLKKGLTLESDTKLLKGEIYTIKDLFTAGTINRKLMKYLANFDFRDVIIRKINLIGADKIDKLSCLFSNKEKSIICEIFGIDKMYRTYMEKSQEAYRWISEVYDDEASSFATAKNISTFGNPEETIKKYKKLFKEIDEK